MFYDLQEEKKEVAALTAGESWEDKLKQVNCNICLCIEWGVSAWWTLLAGLLG